ncbi:MAG TPA: hypothetical protein GX699_08770 [Firmicutes bacterium]|nr:hypothetical protein [Bacillota bacterium]
MNKPQDQREQQLDKKIRRLFAEEMSAITLNDSLRKKLLARQQDITPLSPWQRFLEKEVTVSFAPLTLAAVVMVLACGLVLATLFLPGDIPEPKYRIIEMQAAQVNLNLSTPAGRG